MSSISPPSFIDDGASFRHRLPPADISKWLHGTSSKTSSAYTGSFIDDGADMFLPPHHTPGFGAIDARFYKNRKRRDGDEKGVWNEDIARAVGGDIGRSLGGLRGVLVRKGDRIEDEDGDEEIYERKGRRRTKDTVTIPMPRRWGTIVIKDEGGRVIVVDEDGEFDSGARGEEIGRGDGGGKWVKAPPTISQPSTRVTERKKKHRRRKEKVETLTTIPESEYEEVAIVDEGGSDIMSPTDFFMTGGASGWPSPKPSSGACSSEKSYSKSKSKSRKGSPAHSLPGSWPSPPPSPTKGKAASETSTDTSSSKQSWGKASSHRSRRSGSRRSHSSSKPDHDNVSTKTYSVYKAATVEDALDTSSDNASALQDVGWHDDHKGSEGWGSGKRSSTSTSSRSSSKKSWNDGRDAWGDNEQQHQSTEHDWTSGRVKTVSEAISYASRHSRQPFHTSSEVSATSSRASRHRSHHSHTTSEVTWDGYERPKTESEVSVVGSDSERSWPGSRASSRRSRVTAASRTHIRGGSRNGSQGGWVGSDGWGGSQTANVDGWGGGEMGSGIGRSDIDETSDEGDWSDLKIKIRSRRESVNAWE